jgi:hypothetical protein
MLSADQYPTVVGNSQKHTDYLRRVIVKLRDDIRIEYIDHVEQQFTETDLEQWKKIDSSFPGVTLSRLYVSVDAERIRMLVTKGQELDPTYKPPNLLTYFTIEVPPEYDAEELTKLLNEMKPLIDEAHLESPPAPLPMSCVTAANDPARVARQRYLNPAPEGIDAKHAWTFGGGCGAGINFVDLERGWNRNHEDLPGQAAITLLSGIPSNVPDEIAHGTSVLGIVTALDNNVGIVGIAPQVTARVVSTRLTNTQWSIADAVMSAASTLSFGDVLLLEEQVWDNPAAPTMLVPVEFEIHNFDTIRLATALGIVVIEPAGNGGEAAGRGLDLATLVASTQVHVFDRALPQQFKDSGAIVVGAAAFSSATRSYERRTQFGPSSCAAPFITSNFGNRVDCYARGECVATIESTVVGNGILPSDKMYSNIFAGTSAASAIIAGAAVIVQSIAQERRTKRFSAHKMRDILSDQTPGINTPSANPANDRIGVMPNLKRIIETVFS